MQLQQLKRQQEEKPKKKKPRESKMQFKNFNYTKKKDGETKKYLILLLNEGQEHFGGIELSLLEGDEITKVFNIQKEYETAIKPYVEKAYRQFIKENVTDEFVGNDLQQLSNSK
jgi:hypothetical protein